MNLRSVNISNIHKKILVLLLFLRNNPGRSYMLRSFDCS
jgi:hypothetical protein